MFILPMLQKKLTIGHFFSTLAAPLYLLGYIHLDQMFIQGGSKLYGWIIYLIRWLCFYDRQCMLGGRIYLALTAHEITNTPDANTSE